MKHKSFQYGSLLLLCCFVWINGWVPFQTIGHLHAHAHHHATSHSSPLCTLLCSAGQTAQFSGTPSPPLIQQTASIESTEPTILLNYQATPPVSRGPPYSEPVLTIL